MHYLGLLEFPLEFVMRYTSQHTRDVPNYSGRRRRVLNYRPFVFSFRRTSCMVHAYVPAIYKASEQEQVATSDLEPGLERPYDL